MKKVRFAPSPTGSLHVGNALSAVANRDFGDNFVLRIDDTDPTRNVPGGEEEILRDLEWLGVAWDEGPVRQSERQDLYRTTAQTLQQTVAKSDESGAVLYRSVTLLRADGTATYQLASVVDDVEFGITHVIRGNDHRPNEQLHRELKAVGGNLKALRLALTGRERGPELWAIVAALPPEEALRRIDAAL
jgi:glutamyl/glutaminyl-tRNA synthetase